MRPANNTGEKFRLNLELSAAAKDRLTDLQQRTEAASVTEVLRASLAVYDLLIEHMAKGGKCVLRDSKGNEEVIVIPGAKRS
jgi:hypothetical protein